MARRSKTKKQRDLKEAIIYAARVFQKLVVLEDCLATTGRLDECICFTCGARVPRDRNLHAGHWKKRSKNSVLFERANCNAQCRTCNIYQHGNMRVYEQKIIDKYGQPALDRLIILSKQTKKWTFEELDEMTSEWRKQTKEILKKAGL